MPVGDEVFTLDRTARIQAYVADAMGEQIAANPLQPISIVTAMGIGCVFGIRRDTGRWRFYLQENVRVLYMRQPIDGARFVNRALQVKQIWPNGGPAPLVNPAIKGLV
jgi:hypothetical protein